VRGSNRHALDEEGGQPQKRVRVFISSGDGCDHLIADHLAGFHKPFAGAPEEGMVADREGQPLVDEILDEIVPAEVGELVRDHGVQIVRGQVSEDVCGQQHESSEKSQCDRTEDLR